MDLSAHLHHRCVEPHQQFALTLHGLVQLALDRLDRIDILLPDHAVRLMLDSVERFAVEPEIACVEKPK